MFEVQLIQDLIIQDQFIRRGSSSREKSKCAPCKSYLSSLESFLEYFQSRNTALPERSTLDLTNINLLVKANQSRQSWREFEPTGSPTNINIETSQAVNIPKSEVLPLPKSQQQNKLRLIQELRS